MVVDRDWNVRLESAELKVKSIVNSKCFVLQYEPKARPLFPEIVNKLAEVKESLDDAAWGSLNTNNHYDRYGITIHNY